jgi:hypothetical protein
MGSSSAGAPRDEQQRPFAVGKQKVKISVAGIHKLDKSLAQEATNENET